MNNKSIINTLQTIKSESGDGSSSIVPQEPVDQAFDPMILDKIGGPKYGEKRVTLGNSASLLEGAPSETIWVSLGWIVVPTGIGALLLLAMIYA